MDEDGTFSPKIDYVTMFLEIQNLKGSFSNFAELGNFAYYGASAVEGPQSTGFSV